MITAKTWKPYKKKFSATTTHHTSLHILPPLPRSLSAPASLRHKLPIPDFLTEEISPVAPDVVGGRASRQRASRLVHPAVRVEVRVSDGFEESYASLECVERLVRPVNRLMIMHFFKGSGLGAGNTVFLGQWIGEEGRIEYTNRKRWQKQSGDRGDLCKPGMF